MGSSQSSPNPSAPNDDPKSIEPHGFKRGNRHIQLNSSYSAFYDATVSLVQTNKYADLLVICGDDRYPVHRAVICPRSHVFAEWCEVGGKGDYASPAKPAKVWIDPSECDTHILAAVLTFLYTLDYTASGPQKISFGLPEEEHDDLTPPISPVETCEVESLSAELSDSGLESTASHQFTPSEDPTVESSAATATLSDPGEKRNELVFHTQVFRAGQRFGIASLCDVAKEKLDVRLKGESWLSEIIPCLREIYKHGSALNSTSFKEDVVKVARARFRTLKTLDGWNELVLDFPEFAAELLKRM